MTSSRVPLRPILCRHPAVPPAAGQTPRRQSAAADDRTEATGQPSDIATPQKSGLRPYFTALPRTPGQAGAAETTLTVTPGSPAFLPLPLTFGLKRPQHSPATAAGGPGAPPAGPSKPQAQAHRVYLPGQPGRGLPSY